MNLCSSLRHLCAAAVVDVVAAEDVVVGNGEAYQKSPLDNDHRVRRPFASPNRVAKKRDLLRLQDDVGEKDEVLDAFSSEKNACVPFPCGVEEKDGENQVDEREDRPTLDLRKRRRGFWLREGDLVYLNQKGSLC